MKKFDINGYTSRRIRQLRGERIYAPDTDEALHRYTRRRMQEIRESEEEQRDLDRSPLACYTVGRMGDRDGET